MDSADATCVTRIAQGDPQALDELYLQFRPSLYRYLLHQLGGDAALVEDVLQETFLAIWRAAAAYRGESRVATWVFRIARNNAISAKRRSSAPQTLSLHSIEEVEDFSEATEHEDHTLTRLALNDALSRLTDKQRAVVLLVFVHGFTSEEAAQ